MKIVRILLFLFLTIPILAQDVGVKWDRLPVNDPARQVLRQAVERDYFKILDKSHLRRPDLLIIHCYTPEMGVQSTRVVIGMVRDEVWLTDNDVKQLQRELSIMIFLRKQLQKEGRIKD
jgi:hypothetical protein